jgi:hypothetical protein
MVFRVTPHQAQTLSSWWDEKDDIDLQPIYQRRGRIWSTKQQQDLIDTIINGFDIPKLYVADFTVLNSPLNIGRKKYAVIDGKQRLTTIFDFFENKISLAKHFVFYDDPDLVLGGLSYQDLIESYPKIARKIGNYNLSVMSVITDDEQKINELFLRLNASKPLVGAEIRNAMQGEVPQLIRSLAAHPFWLKTRFSKTRGQDLNTAAKLLLLEHAGTFVDTKKRQIDELVIRANEVEALSRHTSDEALEAEEEDVSATTERLYVAAEEAQTTDIDSAAKRVVSVLNSLMPLFMDNDDVLAQQAQIPVIYWLARDLPQQSLAVLRNFLVKFDEQRKHSRSQSVGQRDPIFLDFEIMTRTSNDQASIAGRYQILRRLFDMFTGASQPS